MRIGLWVLVVIALGQRVVAADWEITAHDQEPYAAPVMANGLIGVTPSKTPMQSKLTILNGVMDDWGVDRVQSLSPAPNFMDIDIAFKGRSVVAGAQISDWRQTLDLKTATLTTDFVLENCLRVSHSLMALRHLPHNALVTLKVQAMCSGDVRVSNKVINPSSLLQAKTSVQNYKWPHARLDVLSHTAETPNGAHKYAAATVFVNAEGHELVAEFNDLSGQSFVDYDLVEGDEVELHLIGALTSSAHFQDPGSEAERLVIFAAMQGPERLLARHGAAWQELWRGDIAIKGDNDAQRAVRFALYNLYASARRGGAYGLAPMGLSSLEYYGHTFWDSELWMLPPLMLLQPELAKSALEYRFRYLDAAKTNAMVHGYKGAMFPWESDDKGQESTPAWALSGAFEHHISAVVGLAFWNYYLVSQDEAWLKYRAYPVLKEVADFWVSRATKNKQGGYDILNVVGADEYAQNVDNNAFTNGAAIAVLRAAQRAAKKVDAGFPAEWEQVAEGLRIERLPEGVTSEYQGYDGRMVKQADVNLLAYPLNIVADEGQVRKDLEYYAPRFDEVHGPAMTNAILSVLASQLGETDKAWKFFEKAYKPKERPPFGALAEATSLNNPYFVTGAGGMLQAVMNGFAGLRVTENGIEQLTTKIPAHWDSVTLTGVGPDKKTYVVDQK